MTTPSWYLGHIPGPCPYLPEREWRLMLVDGGQLGPSYRQLLDEGFRRHGSHLYRPDCINCNACQVHRVPVDTFTMTRSQRRCWKKGQAQFDRVLTEPSCTGEKVALYNAYLAHQHGSKDEPIDEQRYHDFFVATCLPGRTLEVQLRERETGALAAVGIVDFFTDALSSVYCYFDPAWAKISPGTYSALAEIDLARELGLRYYYMGFYIRGCAAMDYKANFSPCELRTMGEDGWRVVDG